MPDKKENVLRNVLDGTLLTKVEVLRHFPFILFSAGLMVLYISNGYKAERIIRDLNTAESHLRELKARYVTISSNLEMIRQQSKVAKAVEGIQLEESTVPPIQILKR
ncbi:MAG: hypothetical protein ACJAY8_000860 [Sphingobacteriales bacterium]|jgi:hypothetical protein